MKPLKSAWIIFWNGTEPNLDTQPIAILNYRRTAKQVALVVEQFYLEHYSTSRERLIYARNGKDNPYPAQIDRFEHISCGHNPWLEAVYVSNLREEGGKLVWEPKLTPEQRQEIIARHAKVHEK